MKLERCFRKKEHPLILREKYLNENEQFIICRICTRLITEASFYACNVCEYYLHISCTLLPDEINHSFHPSHPLKLVTYRSTWCNNCRQDFKLAPLYSCGGCAFDMDVECALMPAKSSPCEQGQVRGIQHISHRHSLLLLVDTNGIECNGCGLTCSTTDLAYGCNKCNFFLHKSCAKFPREVRHPLHLEHGYLSLRSGREDFERCFLCQRFNSGRQGDFFFKCCGCSVRMCWSCRKNVRRPIIMHEVHDHNLYLGEKCHTKLCNGYGGYCTQPVAASSNEFSRTNYNILVCLDCDFKIHMLCGPLPATIKDECHIHCLTLVDSIDEDDYDEHYCDVCETERDPRIRFYYCNECKYFAHVHCLVSEIAKALTEEDELRDHDLELKVVGQDIWNLPSELRYNKNKLDLTLKDLINGLNMEAKNLLKRYYKWDDDISSMNKGQRAGDIITNSTFQYELMSAEDVDETLKLNRFTDRDFKTFFDQQLEKFFMNNELPFKSGDLELKIENVEGYKVPHTVGRVMRSLLYRYGDISSDENSREWNSIVYFVLCEALRRMATTLVIDVTKVDLQEWHYHLTFAKCWGFKVDFACALLVRLVRAFLGLRADKLKDQVPAMLIKRIAKSELEIAKLEKEIAEAKSQLEICKVYSGSSEKSQFMIDCLKEGSDMKWKKACNDRDLSPHHQRLSHL